jgi:sugar phosphate isomerase/epimerase
VEIVLNTIALDPNRWTEKKVPYFRVEDLIEPIAAAGFKALEIWQPHLTTLRPAEVQRLKPRVDDAGISVPILGMYPIFHLEGREREEELARWDQMFGFADVFGACILKVMPGRTPSAEMTPRVWDRSVAFVQEVLRRSEENGTIIPCETHAGTVADNPETLLRFIGEVGSDRLKVCWQPFDFGSTRKAIELYDKLAPHVVHLHLQGRRGREMELLEESDIDYREVLAHIFASGFDGYLSIEFVRDCVVDSPEQFDLDTVLANAQRDRRFVESVPGFK